MQRFLSDAGAAKAVATVAREGAALSKEAIAAEDAENFLYRGVHADHPALAAAKEGRVVPGNADGIVASAAHNEGGHAAESAFTSWTRDPSIAEFHAGKNGPGGVILRVPQGVPPPGATWSWHFSEDIWGESEVLMKGVREGVEVFPR